MSTTPDFTLLYIATHVLGHLSVPGQKECLTPEAAAKRSMAYAHALAKELQGSSASLSSADIRVLRAELTLARRRNEELEERLESVRQIEISLAKHKDRAEALEQELLVSKGQL